jgi:hypothetical protein
VAARRSTARDIPKDVAQKRVVEAIREGAKVAEAMEKVGRKEETYRDWMKESWFKSQIAEIRAVAGRRATKGGPAPVPDFPEFCELLGEPLFPHQLRIYDVMEGREPRDLHPRMVWEPGDPERVVCNMPVGHAKTNTFSINYVVWRIHKDPNIRVVIMSKSIDLARDIVGAIKQRLTSHVFQDVIGKYAPEGGWREPEGTWAENRIRVNGRTSGHKDATVQALGIGGQIYGKRSDLIILDDVVTLSNVGQWETQLRQVTQEIETRIPPGSGGRLIVLGTRIATVDLYMKLRELKDWNDDKVYSYFAQPALLDEGDGKPENWVTLWPYTKVDGELVEMWSGPRLAKRRNNARTWSLVYQQQNTPDDAVFNPDSVEAAINGRRLHGLLKAGALGHREQGMNGLWVIGSVDLAVSGYTAMFVGAVDKLTKKRYILDAVNVQGMGTTTRVNLMQEWTQKYGINEWVIERNAFQGSIFTDEPFKQWMYAHGAILTPHTTGTNKHDPDLGVQSMAPLFESCVELGEDGRPHRRKDGGLIELPSRTSFPVMNQLIEQLITWAPKDQIGKGQKTDLVMALWFFELAARKYIGFENEMPLHMNNPWLSLRDRGQRRVIDINEYMMGVSA